MVGCVIIGMDETQILASNSSKAVHSKAVFKLYMANSLEYHRFPFENVEPSMRVKKKSASGSVIYKWN